MKTTKNKFKKKENYKKRELWKAGLSNGYTGYDTDKSKMLTDIRLYPP